MSFLNDAVNMVSSFEIDISALSEIKLILNKLSLISKIIMIIKNESTNEKKLPNFALF